MKRWMILLGVAACLIVVFLSCLWWPIISFLASVMPAAAPRPVGAAQLLVDISDLPSGWRVEKGPLLIPRDVDADYESIDNAEIYFDRSGNRETAMHQAFRFRNSFEARTKLFSIRRVEFDDLFFQVRWEIPSGWSYKSPNADDFEFACAPVDKILGDADFVGLTRCNAVSRYREFISVFTARTSKGVMSLSDIERVLRSIDAKMVKYVQ